MYTHEGHKIRVALNGEESRLESDPQIPAQELWLADNLANTNVVASTKTSSLCSTTDSISMDAAPVSNECLERLSEEWQIPSGTMFSCDEIRWK